LLLTTSTRTSYRDYGYPLPIISYNECTQFDRSTKDLTLGVRSQVHMLYPSWFNHGFCLCHHGHLCPWHIDIYWQTIWSFLSSWPWYIDIWLFLSLLLPANISCQYVITYMTFLVITDIYVRDILTYICCASDVDLRQMQLTRVRCQLIPDVRHLQI
jgi:hypothetical protein